jgi:hypothetical protein
MEWRHTLVKINQTFSDLPEVVSQLTDYVRSGRRKEMVDTIKLAGLLCEDNEKKEEIADLAILRTTSMAYMAPDL